MRFPDPTRFVPPLVRLGWLTSRIPNPGAASRAGRVYFFRGQAIFFSRGFGRMCEALRREGVWAEDLRCRGEWWACRHLLAEPPAEPVVLVGHSCGGRSALFAADRLRKSGVTVDLLVCLDVTLPPPVPANVRRAVNLYLSGWRLYPAGRLRPAPGAAPRIDNVDVSAPDSPITAGWLCHVTFTDSAAVQDFVVRKILDVVGPARTF